VEIEGIESELVKKSCLSGGCIEMRLDRGASRC
jgi:hypothetical protein